MRRSSWIAIFAALILLAGLVFLQLRPLDTKAPPMNDQTATEFLERGRKAFEARSVQGVLNLTTPDARLLDQPVSQMQLTLQRAFSQMGSEPVDIACKDVRARETGNIAVVDFNLKVGQQSSSATSVYYQSPVTLQLRKQKVDHWLGLYTTEEWRVFDAKGELPPDVGGF